MSQVYLDTIKTKQKRGLLLDNDEQASLYLDKVLLQIIINQIIINTFYLSQKGNKITNEKSVLCFIK